MKKHFFVDETFLTVCQTLCVLAKHQRVFQHKHPVENLLSNSRSIHSRSKHRSFLHRQRNNVDSRTCTQDNFIATPQTGFFIGSLLFLLAVNLAFEFSLLKTGFSVIVILFSFQVDHALRTEINDVRPSGVGSFVACRVMQCASSVNSAASCLQRLRKSLVL